MATQLETAQEVENCLERIGQEMKISFRMFLTDTFTQGSYKSGTWTYEIIQQKVSFVYWFSSFSNRKEEVITTYSADDDKEKLENDLKAGLGKLRQFVNKKKGMF